MNGFPLNLDAKHSVFVAGGIGITPFITMMESLQRAAEPFNLHYAARTVDRFLRLPQFADETAFYTDKDGVPGLNVRALLEQLDTDSDLYVCGPRQLIETVRTEAAKRGWPNTRVHFESFGASVKLVDSPITVHLAQSGLTIKVEPRTTILDALLDNGVWASYECKRGECASCVTEVLSNEIDHRDICLSDKRIEEIFGWIKASAGLHKTKFRGLARVRAQFTLALAAYNLIRLPKLLAAPTPRGSPTTR